MWFRPVIRKRSNCPSGHHGYLSKDQLSQVNEGTKSNPRRNESWVLDAGGLAGRSSSSHWSLSVVLVQEDGQCYANGYSKTVDSITHENEIEGASPYPQSQEQQVTQHV